MVRRWITSFTRTICGIDRQQLKAPLLTGKPCQADLRIVRQDGEVRHVEARGEPIFDEKGNVTHWVGTLFDISDRKCIEEKTAAQRS